MAASVSPIPSSAPRTLTASPSGAPKQSRTRTPFAALSVSIWATFGFDCAKKVPEKTSTSIVFVASRSSVSHTSRGTLARSWYVATTSWLVASDEGCPVAAGAGHRKDSSTSRRRATLQR